MNTMTKQKTSKKSTAIVEALSEQFPKFTRIQFCMVNNPDYGVWYSPKAEAKLCEAGLLPPKKKKAPEARKKQKRISLRFSDAAYESIQNAVANSGCKSTQSFFEQLVRQNVPRDSI